MLVITCFHDFTVANINCREGPSKNCWWAEFMNLQIVNIGTSEIH